MHIVLLPGLLVITVTDLRQVCHSAFSLDAEGILGAERIAPSAHRCNDTQRADVRDFSERV
jgi:hypothetical protein